MLPSRRFILICVSFLLIACSANPGQFNANLRSGMSMSQVQNILWASTWVEDDPFLSGCYRDHFPEKNMGIIAAASGKSWYVFRNQPTLSRQCGESSGPGTYVRYFSSLAAATNFVSRQPDIAPATEPSRVEGSQVTGLDLVGNATSEMRVGLTSKVSAARRLQQLPGSANPFRDRCYREFDIEKKSEIFSSGYFFGGKHHYFVFSQVSQKSQGCTYSPATLGNGVFLGYFNTLEEARSAISLVYPSDPGREISEVNNPDMETEIDDVKLAGDPVEPSADVERETLLPQPAEPAASPLTIRRPARPPN